jgi:hypothetical protein
VNPHQPSTSTTDTHTKWIPVGGTALTAGVILSAHAVLHVSPLTSTILAIALVRREGVVAVLGALFGVLTAIYGIIYIPLKQEAPSAFTTALTDISNAMGFPMAVPPISETGEVSEAPQASAEQPKPASAVAPLSVLPSATNAARMEDEPEYWQLVHDRLSVSSGRPGIVPQPVKGRHARVEVRPKVEATADRAAEHWSQVTAAVVRDREVVDAGQGDRVEVRLPRS